MDKRLLSGVLAFVMVFWLCTGISYAAEEINANIKGIEETAVTESNYENETENELALETQAESESELESEIETDTDTNTKINTETLQSQNEDGEEETEAYEEGDTNYLFQAGGFRVMNEDQGVESEISLFSTGDMDELAEKIYTALKNKESSIELKEYNFFWSSNDDRKQLLMLYYAVINDHPDLYYARAGYKISYATESKKITKILPDYFKNVDDKAFQEGVQKAKSAVSVDMDDLQKAIAIHDYLVLNCEYDKERLADGTMPQESHGAYGVLANRIAVCQGYALAYKYLMNEYGIECYIVTSDSMNHAWNIVKIDGELYQMDATWDDPTWDKYGLVSHSNMFLSDKEFGKNHRDWYVTRGSGIINLMADGTKYDDAFWRDVLSPIVYDNSTISKCYYVSKDKKLQSRFCNTEKIDTTADTLKILDTRYSGLVLNGSRLFYNTNKKIAYIDISKNNDGSYEEQVRFSLEAGDVDNIYGFTRTDNTVRYVKRAGYYLSGKSPIYLFDDSKDSIRYELNGGINNPKNPDMYDAETEDIILAEPTREHYDFLGWYEEPDFKTQVTMIKKGSIGNRTLYAKWEPEKYLITYELDGGENSSLNKTKYDMETDTFYLENPTKKGYAFEGWYEEPDYKTKITAIEKGSMGDRTVYAKWKILEYTLEYVLNEGTNNPQNPTKYNVESDTIHLEAPTHEDAHYVFEGWYTDEDFTHKISDIENGSTGDLCLYAKWTKYYQVRFLDMSGKLIAEMKVAAGEDATAPKADAPKGYEFIKWDKDFTKVHEDMDITAVYDAILYAITYTLNGGINAARNPDTYTIETEDIKFAAPKHKNAELVFAGWYCDKDYKEKIISLKKGSTGDITLYAKWKNVKKDTPSDSHTEETVTNDNQAAYDNAAKTENRNNDTAGYTDDVNLEIVTDSKAPAADANRTPVSVISPNADTGITDISKTDSNIIKEIKETIQKYEIEENAVTAEEDTAQRLDDAVAKNSPNPTDNSNFTFTEADSSDSEEEDAVSFMTFITLAVALMVIIGGAWWIITQKKKNGDKKIL